MILTEQWNALSARIDGLTDAAGLFAQFRSVNATDSYGTGQRFGDQCTSVFQSLREFRNEFESSLSARALEVLDRFLREQGSLFPDESGTLNFGAMLMGTGKIWIDNVTIEVVPKDTKTTSVRFDRPTNTNFDE